jgi:hypothetical protein
MLSFGPDGAAFAEFAATELAVLLAAGPEQLIKT